MVGPLQTLSNLALYFLATSPEVADSRNFQYLDPMAFYGLTARTLAGEMMSMSSLKGRVVLVTNVASR